MKAFRCSRTGVLFPADFVEEWGKKYGIGLGPVPVSEALTNVYDAPVVDSNGSLSNAMHPLGVCKSQVDLVDVSEEEFEQSKAIIDLDDPGIIKRASLMRDKQLQKSVKLQSMYPNQIASAKIRIEERTTKANIVID